MEKHHMLLLLSSVGDDIFFFFSFLHEKMESMESNSAMVGYGICNLDFKFCPLNLKYGIQLLRLWFVYFSAKSHRLTMEFFKKNNHFTNFDY